MPASSWLIGSHANVPQTTLTVTANSVAEDVTVAAGAYYVDDTTSSLSLIQTMATAIATHSEITTCTASLRQDRIVRFTADVAFTVTFGGSTVRDMIGAAGNWNTPATTQVGDEPSGYIWVPGKDNNSTDTPINTEGRRIYDTQVSMSGPGNVESVQNNYYVFKDLEWRFITNYPTARVWDEDESNGQYVAFFRKVVRKFFKFKHYRRITNDESSTTDIALASPFGPYILRADRIQEDYERGVPNADTYAHVQLPAVKTAEYT